MLKYKAEALHDNCALLLPGVITPYNISTPKGTDGLEALASDPVH